MGSVHEPIGIRKDYKKMTPNQQIIPGPRSSETRLSSSRSGSIEISRPGAKRPAPEASVNYAALLRRHRKPVTMILGGTLLLALLYTFVAHKSYKSEAILEV